ncbi:hypothetical protein ACFYTS_10220 [Nocardia sp. NPDC004151]|uniref:hypothetical protein n=1 Tax=Nocardia sp. NPDC004151 TaxID=3364304 RepID=UPI0036AD24BA
MGSPSAHRGRRIGWGTAGFTAAMAMITAGAPTASAEILAFRIIGAENYYTGTAYTVTASLNYSDADKWVSFYDNGRCVTGTESAHVGDSEMRPWASITWVPATAGHHVLSVEYAGQKMTVAVDVQSAPAGSTPATPPATSPCGLAGQLTSGSAGWSWGSARLF